MDRRRTGLLLLPLELRGGRPVQLGAGSLAVILLDAARKLLGHGRDVTLAAGGPARGRASAAGEHGGLRSHNLPDAPVCAGGNQVLRGRAELTPARRQDRERLPALDRDMAVEVAVIGAGIVGLTTALLLEREGMNVAVLEMRHVGAGATGYTTAKLSSLHGLTYRQFAKSIGCEKARVRGGEPERASRVFELAPSSRSTATSAASRTTPAPRTASDLDKVREEAGAGRASSASPKATSRSSTALSRRGRGALRRSGGVPSCEYLDGWPGAPGPVTRGHAHHGHRLGPGSTARGPRRAPSTSSWRRTCRFSTAASTSRALPPRALDVVAGRIADPPTGMYLSTESPAHSIRAHGDWLLVGGESRQDGPGGRPGERRSAWRLGGRALRPRARAALGDQDRCRSTACPT